MHTRNWIFLPSRTFKPVENLLYLLCISGKVERSAGFVHGGGGLMRALWSFKHCRETRWPLSNKQSFFESFFYVIFLFCSCYDFIAVMEHTWLVCLLRFDVCGCRIGLVAEGPWHRHRVRLSENSGSQDFTGFTQHSSRSFLKLYTQTYPITLILSMNQFCIMDNNMLDETTFSI